MSKKIWIATGLVASIVGVTAIVAHAERGSHDGRGYDGHHRGGWGDDEGGRRGWRGHWGREKTKAEFEAKTRSRFAKWDANSDGVVDAAEAEAGVSSRMERRRSRWGRGGGRMRQRMQRYDTDRDGRVTLAEIQTMVTERFQRIDLTGDGRITDEDLPPIMRGRNILSGEAGMKHRGWGRGHHRGERRHHGGRHGKRMMRMLIGADTNKDGAVTLQEAQDRAAQRFARFDRNKDSAIDQADRDTLRKQMLDYRVARLMHRYGAKDGKLTLEQFTAERNKRFARRDADGDGTIERDEMRGGRHSWGGHRRWGRDRDEDRGGRSEHRGGDERGPQRRDAQ